MKAVLRAASALVVFAVSFLQTIPSEANAPRPTTEQHRIYDGTIVRPALNTTTITQQSTYLNSTRVYDNAGNFYLRRADGDWQKLNLSTYQYEPFVGTVDLQGGTISPNMPNPMMPNPMMPNPMINTEIGN